MEWINTGFAVAAGAIAAYVAIRADLAALKAQMLAVQSAVDRAHVRIDTIVARDQH